MDTSRVLAEALALDSEFRRDVRVEELGALLYFDVRGDLCGDSNVGAGKVGAGKLFVCVNSVAVGPRGPTKCPGGLGQPTRPRGAAGAGRISVCGEFF